MCRAARPCGLAVAVKTAFISRRVVACCIRAGRLSVTRVCKIREVRGGHAAAVKFAVGGRRIVTGSAAKTCGAVPVALRRARIGRGVAVVTCRRCGFYVVISESYSAVYMVTACRRRMTLDTA